MSFLRAACLGLNLTLGALTFGGLTLGAVNPALAQSDTITADQQSRLWDALDMPGALDVMRREGLSLADEVAEQYLVGRTGASWQDAVATIYDGDAMGDMMMDGMVADLGGADPDPMLAFFESDLGQRIITLEMSAREVFLDSDMEEAARDRVRTDAIDPDRMELIDEFIAVNDLVDYNTSGAMNTNVAFLRGLATSEIFEMGEQEILDGVWGDSDASRSDTEEWLRAYLSTAYQPLSDEDLRAYIAFSETEAGQRLNRALFVGFGDMYTYQYNALGLAVAQQLAGQDL
ncbi:hypothetical protein [Pseudooceanicola sp. MF1-13]|uniref:hypothetical protein n=1 Tax=Pseudooceanicola sp. MF1-13 TaxID=3379095 RepID=UPI003891E542